MTNNIDKPLVKLDVTETRAMTKDENLIFRHNGYCMY